MEKQKLKKCQEKKCGKKVPYLYRYGDSKRFVKRCLKCFLENEEKLFNKRKKYERFNAKAKKIL